MISSPMVAMVSSPIAATPRRDSRMRTGLALVLLLATASSASCHNGDAERSQQEAASSSAERALVRAAFQRARGYIVAAPKLELDEIWVAQQAARLVADDEFAAQLEGKVSSQRESLYFRLLDPKAAPPALPDDASHGLARFFNNLMTPFAEPWERGLQWLRRFVGEDVSGYILTHQLLALEWALALDRTLPRDLDQQRPKLVAKIRSEQQADRGGYSDLYAERAFVLALFGQASVTELREWALVIAGAQQDDASWGNPPITYSYDGQSRTAQRPMHAVVLCAAAMGAYLAVVDTGPLSKAAPSSADMADQPQRGRSARK
jgi:hypothetical protein